MATDILSEFEEYFARDGLGCIITCLENLVELGEAGSACGQPNRAHYDRREGMFGEFEKRFEIVHHEPQLFDAVFEAIAFFIDLRQFFQVDVLDVAVFHDEFFVFTQVICHLPVEPVGDFVQKQQVLDTTPALFREHTLEAVIGFESEVVACGFALEGINLFEKIIGERARRFLAEIFFVSQVRAAHIGIDDDLVVRVDHGHGCLRVGSNSKAAAADHRAKLLSGGAGQSKCGGLFRVAKISSFVTLLFALSSGVFAAKEKVRFTLVQIEKRSYLSLGNLKRVHNDLTVSYNAGEEQGEIRFGKRIILFSLGKAEYQSQNEIRELDGEGVIEDDGLFFSREFIEEILTELSLPVSYKFQKNNLIIVRDKEREGLQKLDFIYIDAGHGGRDSGALGYFDYAEKDITLSLAHALKDQLATDFPKVKIYLTRSGDKFIRLEKRSELANKRLNGAPGTPGAFGIFVSVHCNSHLSPKVKGFEIYYLAQNPDNKQSRELQLRENQGFEKSGYIKRLTSQLMNAQIQRESKTLARAVFKGISIRLDGMIKPRKVKKADFAVLRGSLMPAILIETGYLTNRDDLKKLRSSEYSKAFAAGVSRGIGAFLGELSKAEK